MQAWDGLAGRTVRSYCQIAFSGGDLTIDGQHGVWADLVALVVFTL